MKESIKKSEDLNNELGVAFEKHSGILISKILKKEDSTYFNLKFSVARAIALIKQDLIKELFKGGKKEYDVYVKINDLVLICDKYLNEVKNTSDMPSNSNNKDCETDSSEFKKKIPNIQKKYCSAKQNKCQTKVNFSSNNSSISCKKDLNSSINISHINSGSNSDKNDFLKSNIISADEIIENKEQNPTKNKNKAKKEETDINKITSSELEEHEEGDTTSIISKKRKSNNELNGEIDIIIADVTKKDFEKLIKEENNKYYLTNKKANLPDKFNIIIEACVNLGTQTIEKKVEEEKKEEEGENQIELDYVEKAHTYIYYKLSFSESINPKLKGPNDEEPGDLIQDKNAISAPNEKVNKSIEKEEIKENPNHSELIDTNKIVDALTGKDLKSIPEKEDVFEEKKEEEEEIKKVKPIAADEICNDFRKYIKIFIANICKSYDETMGAGDSNKNPNVKRDKGGAGSILNNVKKEERDKNINNFLLKYIENGKAGMI